MAGATSSALNPSISARLAILSPPDFRIALTLACAAPEATIMAAAIWTWVTPANETGVGGAVSPASSFAEVVVAPGAVETAALHAAALEQPPVPA
jgi:hypothetical protein